jgi:Ran GTPase-activating protein (RanGAP) involved in mRNA processing and transport
MLHLRISPKTLATLDLASNKIGNQGTQHLADALRNGAVNVFSFLSLLFIFIFFMQNLIKFNLSSNEIGYDGIKHLADAIKNNKVTFVFS